MISLHIPMVLFCLIESCLLLLLSIRLYIYAKRRVAQLEAAAVRRLPWYYNRQQARNDLASASTFLSGIIAWVLTGQPLLLLFLVIFAF